MDQNILKATRLWTLAQPSVSAYVSSMVRNFSDRDDVLQEVAVAVLESFHRFDSSRSFNAWAMGIAKNQILLYFRKRKSEVLLFDEQTAQLLCSAFAEEADVPWDFQHLDDCMQQLDPKNREVCRLRYEQDLKPADIGVVLSISANTVSKMLQRVRQQLRLCIERKSLLQGC